MSSSGPELDAVGPGLELRLALPGGAREVPPERLPAVDLSAIAGARLTLRRGVEADGLELRAVCAAAPSDRWAPSVEELVLDRASGMARAALGASIARWDAGAIVRIGDRFEQPFEGSGGRTPTGVEPPTQVGATPTQVESAAATPTQVESAAAPFSIHGRHVLGFAGADHTAVLCTVICLEPASRARCGALVEAAAIEGTFVPAPEPSLLIRALLLAAEQPHPMAAALALAASAAVALLLARRPRPRP